MNDCKAGMGEGMDFFGPLCQKVLKKTLFFVTFPLSGLSKKCVKGNHALDTDWGLLGGREKQDSGTG